MLNAIALGFKLCNVDRVTLGIRKRVIRKLGPISAHIVFSADFLRSVDHFHARYFVHRHDPYL